MRERQEPIQLARHYAEDGKTLQKILEEYSEVCYKISRDHLETAAHDMV